MTLEEMREAAIEEAMLYAEPDCLPIITVEFYATIVPRNQRASIHEVNTAYIYGDVVQLAVRNGHRYMCVQAGTSAATAPDFPTRSGSGVNDGDDLIWQEAGPDYENVYDIRAMIHQAWVLKTAKSSHLVSKSSGNSRTEYSNLQAQCRDRAREFSPTGVA